MNNVIVPLNAFNREEVLEKGQDAFIESIARSGAFGVEIRRELFPIGILQLEIVKKEIERWRLFTVYSAPIELLDKEGQLNKEVIQRSFQEARILGASWVKTSLGHYHPGKTNFIELNELLFELNLQEEPIQLLVENDQTMYGGSICKLKRFFENASLYKVPVKMTFDIGNWYYTEQNVLTALEQLGGYVGYLHLKHVEGQNELTTLPIPTNTDAEWRHIVRHFPAHLKKALEFPINPISNTKSYIKMVEEADTSESREIKCNN